MQIARIVVVGDNLDSLKVKLLTAYVAKSLPDEDVPTTFFNFSTSVTYKSKQVNLALLDTSGQEEFDMLRQISYAQANGFLLVFSLQHPLSLKSIKTKWVPEIRQFAPNVPYILVGCYFQSREHSSTGLNVPYAKGMRASRKIGAIGYYECSPDLYMGVEEVFEVATGIGINDPDALKAKSIENVINMVKEKRLEALVFAYSGLRAIPNLPDMSFLKKIVLNDNELMAVPSSIGNLSSLEELNVDGNRISTIHRSVFTLQKLAVFSAKGNCIVSAIFPKDSVKLPSLHTLILANNSLTDFPLSITGIPSLTHLDLTGNSISSIPVQICRLPLIEKLHLGFNHLSTIIPEIEALSRLKILCMDHNNLTGLPPQIGRLELLTQLSLQKNQISFLPPEIGRLPKLEILQLSDNCLTVLPDELGQLLSLKVLEVDNNRLTALPFQIGFLPLDVFEFTGNLLDIPQNIQERGPRVILPYLRDLSKGTDRLYKMKLMFVGMEGVGKTTLFKKLRGYDTKMQDNISTDGIDIGEWSLLVTNPKAKKTKKNDADTSFDEQVIVKFSSWDFGGQEIFYSTHQFFISQRSLYLIVFSLINVDESRIEYWLNAIRTGARKAPVIIVGSHLDHPKCRREVAMKTMESLGEKFQQFKNIKGYYAISSMTGEGMDELKNAIEEVSFGQATMGEVIPGSYRIIEGMLASSRAKLTQCPLITLKEFKDLARKSGLTDEMAITRALKFFHEIGTIVHFDKSENQLRDTVILDPQWLANLMSTLITFQHRFVKEGIVTMSELAHLWRPPEYPPEIHDKLLTILEILEVCFTMKDKVMLPSLLPEKPPPFGLFPEDSYKPIMTRLFKFDFMPFGFFSRIMVRTLHTMDCLHYWKSGMIIVPKRAKSESGAVGMLRLKDNTLEINITVPLDAQILLAEADIGHFLKDLANSPKPHTIFEQLRNETGCSPSRLISLLEKKTQSRSHPAILELKKTFDTLLDGDRFGVSGFISSLIEFTIETMRKTVNECGVTGTAGLNSVASDTDAIHMLRIIVESVESLVKWYNTQMEVLVPCIVCIEDNKSPPHMFSMKLIEETFIKKDIIVDGKKSIGVLCPMGHSYKKLNNYNDGELGPVVELSRLAPDITMNDLYNIVISFDKVELLNELGRGSFGVVLKGRWGDKDVAVKQMLAGNIESEDYSDDQKAEILHNYREFRHEAWIMSNLSHPNIVKMYGLCLTPLCMVTEFIPNGDLFRFLHKEIDIAWNFKLKIALDIAKGMEYLHSVSPPLIHRDLKSPNVLMASFDPVAQVNCKIADFGLTRMLTRTARSADFYNPRWLAPEIMKGEEYTEKVDVFSFGVILWEIYTREKPYNDITFDRQIEDKVLAGERLPIPSDCPPEYSELISHCWQQDPNVRPSFSYLVRTLRKMTQNGNDNGNGSQADQQSEKKLSGWAAGTIKRDRSPTVKKMNNARLSPDIHAAAAAAASSSESPTTADRKTGDPSRPLFRPEEMGLQMVQSLDLLDSPQSLVVVEKQKQVWVGRYDGVIMVFHSKSYKMVHYWPAHDQRVNSLLVVQDYVWSCSDDGTVCVWDQKSLGTFVDKGLLHKPVLSLLLVPGVVLSGASDGTISKWDANQPSKMCSMGCFGVTGPVCSMLADDRGKIWVGTEGDLHVLSAMTYKIVKSVKAHQKAIKSLIQVGKYVWSGSDDCKIGVWNTSAITQHKMLSYHTGRVMCLLEVNSHVWSGSFDKSFVLWDAMKQETLGGIEQHKDTVRAMAHVGDHVWVASLDKSISVWKYISGVGSSTGGPSLAKALKLPTKLFR